MGYDTDGVWHCTAKHYDGVPCECDRALCDDCGEFLGADGECSMCAARPVYPTQAQLEAADALRKRAKEGA